jgi:hypothetical protein
MKAQTAADTIRLDRVDAVCAEVASSVWFALPKRVRVKDLAFGCGVLGMPARALAAI